MIRAPAEGGRDAAVARADIAGTAAVVLCDPNPHRDRAYDILVAGLRSTIYANAAALATRELQMLPSTHGEQSGVIGCAAMILDHVLSAGAIDADL